MLIGPVVAGIHGRAGAWRPLEDAIERYPIVVHVSIKELPILVFRDHATVQILEPQWPRDVTQRAIVVPAANSRFERGLRVAQRSLADQIDRATRIAAALKKSIGTAQNFDVIVRCEREL